MRFEVIVPLYVGRIFGDIIGVTWGWWKGKWKLLFRVQGLGIIPVPLK